MNCPSIERISAYVDHEENEPASRELERHLFTCSQCRSRYRELRSFRATLAISPQRSTLPHRLELSLMAQTQAFLAADSPIPLAEIGPNRAIAGVHPLTHVVAALALIVFALTGMAFFSLRGGSMPSLSSVEHHIEGLPELGYIALREHVSRTEAEQATTPTRPPLLLAEFVLQPQLKRPELDLSPWQSYRMGEMRGSIMDARFHKTPLSIIALPRAAALDQLGVLNEPVDACFEREFSECYSDDVGTSLCIVTRGPALEVWVAHLPLSTLSKLAGVAS